jgi:CheY-like chemotaxis protein
MEDNHILLIAEDDITNYIYLKEVVEDYFKEIIHAVNGLEAFNICSENSKISLILMDMKMPVMDGFEAAAKIKKILPEVPIIAQTAFAFSEDKLKALEAGCDEYVSKPVVSQTLIDLIEKYRK